MKPGIYPNLSNEEYHSTVGISSSGLSIIAEKTPAHYKASLLTPRKETPAMADGTRLHAAILEPHLFESRYAPILPHDKRTKEGKAYWQEWQEANVGKLPVTPDDRDQAQRIRDILWADTEVESLLINARIERSVFATDPETGVVVKCRPDADNISMFRWLVDVKSTEDASEEAFSWSAYRYGYYRQAAFYLDVCSWTGNEPPPEDFYFIAFEKVPPYGYRVYRASPRMLARGRESYRMALNTYAECVRTDDWPCYSKTVAALDLPEVIHKRLEAADNDEVMEISYDQ